MAEPRSLQGPVVLATGGTGGHVFPAEALAGELEARGVPFTLVTDSRGKQWQGALAHRPIHYIHSASPTGSLGRRLMAMMSLGRGLFDAWRALGRIGPSAVVGFGGYASVPTMLAARLRRLPSMLHEQNAVLGQANRLRAGRRGADRDLVRPHRGTSPTATAGRASSAIRCASRCGRCAARPTARRARAGSSISWSSAAARVRPRSARSCPRPSLSLPAALRARLRLVQQCRPEDLEQVRQRYARAGIVVELAPFFADLPQRLAAAHLVIGRAGASTVAELAAIGRPSILVPYPYAADDHQTANARAFEAAGACIVIPHAAVHRRDPGRPPGGAWSTTPQRLADMAAAAHAAGRPDAAARLADLVGEMTGLVLSPSGVAA